MANPFDVFSKLGDTIGYSASKTGQAFSSASSNFWDDITGKTNAQLANSAQYLLQKDQQDFNAWQAQLQRDWSAQSVQRSVADIKAAGLNPWLAIQGGVPGAASASSATSSQGSASQGNSQLGLMAVAAGTVLGTALKLMLKKGK